MPGYRRFSFQNKTSPTSDASNNEIVVSLSNPNFRTHRFQPMSPHFFQGNLKENELEDLDSNDNGEQTVSLLTPTTPMNLPPTPTLGISLQHTTRRSFSHNIPLISTIRRVSASILFNADPASQNTSSSDTPLRENSYEPLGPKFDDLFKDGLNSFLSSSKEHDRLCSNKSKKDSVPSPPNHSLPSTSQPSLRTRRIGPLDHPITIPIDKPSDENELKIISGSRFSEDGAPLLIQASPNEFPVKSSHGVSLLGFSRSHPADIALPSNLRASIKYPNSASSYFPKSKASQRKRRQLRSSKSVPPPVLYWSKSLPSPSGRKAIRWVGVNCHEHHDQSQPSPKGSEPTHFNFAGSPTTPHIIISPDLSEHQTEFQFTKESENKNKDSTSENASGNEESSAGPYDEQSISINMQSSTNFSDNPNTDLEKNGEFPEAEEDRNESNERKNSDSRNWSCKGSLRSPLEKRISTGDTASISSVNNSPTDENGQSYFQQPEDSHYKGPVYPSPRWDNESLILCISALYGKLLVVMGMAFPIAEVISADVPRTLYDSFYLYLYFGSILFLVYAYLFLLRRKSLTTGFFAGKFHRIKKEKDERPERTSMSPSSYKTPKYTITETSNHGSMYLKMGACVFGIGSMIYSGLEFGQFFELSPDPACADILLAVKPIGRMLFTFLQMYFIFLNSRVAISKHTVVARFGLMHMVATNLCIWLNVLVQETKHEIYNLTHHGTSDYMGDSHHEVDTNSSAIHYDDDDDETPRNLTDEYADYAISSENIMDNLYNNSDNDHNIVRRETAFHDHLSGCRRLNLMGDVVNEASPFLFPCTIEYSLLCAGVLYVMWKNINVNKPMKPVTDADSDISTFIARKVRHHYSVDCARASRGLFMGIFVLVLTIISLILFYVLMSNEQFKDLAILEANIVELVIYSVSIATVIYGMKQMRELEFIQEGDIELDNILLLIAQAGVYVYTSFTIIGGYFNVHENHTLNLMTATVTLIQATLQTLFILDGSRRCCYTADQLDRKPGREMVTFLVVCNLAMWAISTFETSRADVHPTQLNFYGVWAWTIISHVSMPLAIFYRFHVTVCLGEIWKRSYKLKNEFIMTL